MITCALWDIESRELESTVHKWSLSIHLKPWSHPLGQSEPSILILYIPLTVLISMFHMEHTNELMTHCISLPHYFPEHEAFMKCGILSIRTLGSDWLNGCDHVLTCTLVLFSVTWPVACLCSGWVRTCLYTCIVILVESTGSEEACFQRTFLHLHLNPSPIGPNPYNI